MGSPNFAPHKYITLGYVPEDENEYCSDVYEDVEGLVSVLNSFLYDYSMLKDYECCPFQYVVSYGYHVGVRIELDEFYDSVELMYEDCATEDSCRSEFLAAYTETLDYALYILKRVAQFTGLKGIVGGWCGGTYDLDPPSEVDQRRFEDVFDSLLSELKTMRFNTFSFKD